MLLDASLWPNVERRLHEKLGAPLRPLDQLGRARENRITWAADAEGIGEVIVKARFRDRAGAKTRWCARNLPLLAARGYPVPEFLWFGTLDRDWYLVVQRRLLGHPTQKPDEQLLGELLSLVELQADAGIESGPRDMAGYHALVLFEGWDHFWRDAEAVSAEAQRVCARLRRLLRPVWGHRLEASDFAHGDLNLSNVLVEGSTISGVVDWDEFGPEQSGSRPDLDLVRLASPLPARHDRVRARCERSPRAHRRARGRGGLAVHGLLCGGDSPRSGTSPPATRRARGVARGGRSGSRFDRRQVAGTAIASP